MIYSAATGLPVYSENEMIIRSEIAVCVTGHREKAIRPYMGDPNNLDITKTAVEMMLSRYIDIVMKRGYTTLLSGLAEGTDLWAAKHVLNRKRYTDKANLIGVMPYIRHCTKFSAENTELLCEVERYADFLVTTNDDPNIEFGRKKSLNTDPGLYRARNKFLVENSSVMIAFYNNDSSPHSGTGQTVRLAERAGMPVFRFSIDDVYTLLDRAGTDKMAIYKELNSLKFFVPKPAAMS